MRELKFRAFYDGKMYEVQSLEWMEYDDCPASAYLFGVKGWVIVDDGKMPKDSKGIAKLLQWTGLKDRNGVEIYEGDILQTDWGIGKVESRNSCFGVFDKNHSLISLLQGLFISMKNVVVIGNIYENHELLEGE